MTNLASIPHGGGWRAGGITIPLAHGGPRRRRGVAAAIAEFVERTEPHEFDLDHMREMLRRGPANAPAPVSNLA